MQDDLKERLREHATDWHGSQMPDGEPAKGDPTAGTMREAAARIEALEALLERFVKEARVGSGNKVVTRSTRVNCPADIYIEAVTTLAKLQESSHDGK